MLRFTVMLRRLRMRSNSLFVVRGATMQLTQPLQARLDLERPRLGVLGRSVHPRSQLLSGGLHLIGLTLVSLGSWRARRANTARHAG